MNVAVIDIGSNTMKVGVYNIRTNKTFEKIAYEDEYVGLYSHMNSGHLDMQGFDALCDCIEKFKEFSKKYGVVKVVAFATAALRLISDKQELLNQIKESTDVEVTIISAKEESYYDYLSVKSIVNDDFLMMDLGGGSMQVISSKDKEIHQSVSLPLGSLRMYEEFASSFLITPKEASNIKAHAMELLKKHGFEKVKSDKIYVMSGTARTLVKLCDELNGSCQGQLTVGETKSLYSKIYMDKDKGIAKLVKVAKDRAKTLFTGTFVILGVCEYFGVKRFDVVDQTIKEGYLSNLIENNLL